MHAACFHCQPSRVCALPNPCPRACLAPPACPACSWGVSLAQFPHPAAKSASMIGRFAPTFLFASIMFQVRPWGPSLCPPPPPPLFRLDA